MPLGAKPECTKCGTIETVLWHTSQSGNLCNHCHHEKGQQQSQEEPQDNQREEKADLNSTTSELLSYESATPRVIRVGRPARKSTRVTRYGCRPSKAPGQFQSVRPVPKGKGRRHIFKKTPMKSPAATATPVTSSFVFYKGSYFQVGDIVSMQDIDGGIYYAQIRGLLTDQYCEKSAAVTWLLPTTASPPPESGFSPETYIIGPEEDLPRKLEYMEFVMHAPSDYYKLKNTPYPPILTEGGCGYIWTSLRNEALKK